MGGGLEEGGVGAGPQTGLADDGKRMLMRWTFLVAEQMGGGLEEGGVLIGPDTGLADDGNLHGSRVCKTQPYIKTQA